MAEKKSVGLSICGLSKTFYGQNGAVEALKDLSFDVPAGSFASIIGPSGCGKSTFFSILTGLEAASSGSILLDGEAPERLLGCSAYMPQDDALLPWLRIIDNVAIGCTEKISKEKKREKAMQLLERAGLGGFARSYPSELSGGMRQRAAFLRTLMADRPLLCLDEPFGALDSVTREQMQTWLAQQRSISGATVIMVTHDVTEAVYLSDIVYVLTSRPGTLSDRIVIDLPKERPMEIKETKEFAEYELRLRTCLREAMGI